MQAPFVPKVLDMDGHFWFDVCSRGLMRIVESPNRCRAWNKSRRHPKNSSTSIMKRRMILRLMRSIVTIPSLAIALVGCASAPSWHKEGVSPRDRVSEQSACKYEIMKYRLPASERQIAYQECMKSKGFRLR